jgi:hypothetical protein
MKYESVNYHIGIESGNRLPVIVKRKGACLAPHVCIDDGSYRAASTQAR